MLSLQITAETVATLQPDMGTLASARCAVMDARMESLRILKLGEWVLSRWFGACINESSF